MALKLVFQEEINSLFLVFLSILGGFGYRLLGCGLQDKLLNHPVYRQIAFFIVIVFTTSFLDSGKISPLSHLLNACMVFIFFTLFTKLTLNYSLTIFILLLLIYVCHKFEKYYQYEIDNNKTISKNFHNYLTFVQNLNNILIVITVLILIIGTIKYYFLKKKEFGKKFNYKDFFLGTHKCNK